VSLTPESPLLAKGNQSLFAQMNRAFIDPKQNDWFIQISIPNLQAQFQGHLTATDPSENRCAKLAATPSRLP
jgi:hypothetical protein